MMDFSLSLSLSLYIYMRIAIPMHTYKTSLMADKEVGIIDFFGLALPSMCQRQPTIPSNHLSFQIYKKPHFQVYKTESEVL